MAINIILAVSIVAYAVAEPPIGDSYSYADHSHQRSLSQEYGTPAFGFGSRSIDNYKPSEEYGVPGLGLNHQKLAKSFTQVYGPDKERALPSLEYGTPAGRSKLDDLSRQYIPAQHSNEFRSQDLSTDYGVPATRSFGGNALSQHYGVPEGRIASDMISVEPSDSYGAPLTKSGVSDKYGAPDSFGSSQLGRTQTLSKKYGTPRANFGSSFSSYNTRSQSSRKASEYPARSSQYNAGPKSSSYQKPSESYGVPNERSLSAEYGVPSKNLNTNAFVSSYETARSVPSQKYGPPSRDAMPSDQYGIPDFNSVSSQGYSYARNALDELLNQEPANYDFGYKVNDLESGSDFGHTETRQDNRAEGSYFVVLPDGSKQVVEYEADERGFKPRISVEPAESRGYDDNASDLARTVGPY